MAAIERYCAPQTLDEAVEILRPGNVTIVAGGTDLMVQSQIGKLKFKPVLMNIQRIGGMRGIRAADGTIRIGALTTMTELLESELVRAQLGILWQACDQFASDQLRNAATLGGNICNASPAGDTLVPMLVLNARVVLLSKPNGSISTRTVPLAQFFAGPGRTHRLPGELLTEIEIPEPPAGFHGIFFKFGTRPALDISTISIGLGALRDAGRLRDVRIAYGSVAPTPIRGPLTEAALEGRALDSASIEAAVQAAADEVHPISDVRASGWYRSEMIRNTLRRMLTHVDQG
jgi:CO/xanthine dehydrogenase FAD-binding subunit